METKPKPIGFKISEIDPRLLCHGRYGTDDMSKIWGQEQTYQYNLTVLGEAAMTLSNFDPDIVPHEIAKEIVSKARLSVVNPQRIREIEDETDHAVLAIAKALEEVVSENAKPHIGQIRTSADTTETAKALQLKDSLEVIINSLENLRDITLERSMEWIDDPHMDQTHLYDALPSCAGRTFSFFAEMLQSDLDFIKFVYKNSIKGKWAGATGNHHSANDLDVDGILLQKLYCDKLGIGNMIAPAQIPGREFMADIFYVIARFSQTMSNLADYVRWGFSDDVDIFRDTDPKERKGSSEMPHKEAKGGNRIVEEQSEAFDGWMIGAMATALAICKFDYARTLKASAPDRINLEDMFKWGDFTIRRLARVIYYMKLNRERSIQRILRTNGIVTSSRVLTYLTDHRKVQKPMPRFYAHDLLGKLARQAYEEKRSYADVIIENTEIARILNSDKIRELTNPLTYIGQSRKIVENVFNQYHGKKTLV
ncbi:MAG: hypothetical protein HY831_04980 [Candidatus Aenigmarchaeota archaeon]|nr:hypothetical protein [Candidatus Aenigmarchaeota archaeon]